MIYGLLALQWRYSAASRWRLYFGRVSTLVDRDHAPFIDNPFRSARDAARTVPQRGSILFDARTATATNINSLGMASLPNSSSRNAGPVLRKSMSTKCFCGRRASATASDSPWQVEHHQEVGLLMVNAKDGFRLRMFSSRSLQTCP